MSEEKTDDREAQIDRMEKSFMDWAEKFVAGEAGIEIKPIAGHFAGGFTIRLTRE